MKLATTLVAAAVVTLGLGTASYAADLIIEEPAIVEPVIVGGNWDGVYIGGFVGAGWGNADHVPDGGPCAPDGCDVDLGGWLVGATVGANFTVGSSFVLGVAGDIAWSDINGSEDFGGIIGVSEHVINWQGSLRGVAGIDAGAFMPYLTAGVAFANASHWSDFSDEWTDQSHVGWTAGAGVQFAVADNIALDLQYRHSEYSEETYDEGFGPLNPVFGLSSDQITAGVNFRF